MLQFLAFQPFAFIVSLTQIEFKDVAHSKITTLSRQLISLFECWCANQRQCLVGFFGTGIKGDGQWIEHRLGICTYITSTIQTWFQLFDSYTQLGIISQAGSFIQILMEIGYLIGLRWQRIIGVFVAITGKQFTLTNDFYATPRSAHKCHQCLRHFASTSTDGISLIITC